MRTFVAVLLCSSLAFAEAPDAPIIEDIPGSTVRLRTGEPAPFDGQLLSFDEQVRRGKRLATAEAELEAAHASVLVSKPVLVALILGSIAAGAAIATGVTLAVKR